MYVLIVAELRVVSAYCNDFVVPLALWDGWFLKGELGEASGVASETDGYLIYHGHQANGTSTEVSTRKNRFLCRKMRHVLQVFSK